MDDGKLGMGWGGMMWRKNKKKEKDDGGVEILGTLAPWLAWLLATTLNQKLASSPHFIVR